MKKSKNNNQKKYSIIIPCYNSFEKMTRCLRCLEEQTCKNFEVIIIDDCSTDNTFSNLANYIQKSNLAFKLIKNDNNLGAGYSRNIGIEKSNGEYLLFLDSDDYIATDTIEIFENILNNDNSIDCILFDYIKYKNNVEQIFSILPNQNYEYIKTDISFKFVRGCTCGKVYKREIIIKNDIRFSSAVRNEDMPFTKVAISYCNRIYYYRTKPLYYYVMNASSLMHNKKLLDENNAYNSFKIVEKCANKKYNSSLEIVFIKECLYSMLQTMILKGISKKNIKKELSSISKKYTNWYNNKDIKHLDTGKRIVLFFYKKSMFFPIKLIFFIKEKIYD